MCDYSLHGVKNRLAVQGESLVVHRFVGGSKGLASPADLEAVKPRGFKRLTVWLGFEGPNPRLYNIPAVCVPPGAKLYLEGIPKEMRDAFDFRESEEVVFTQLTAEPFRYRDAFRFSNGAEVLVQRFPEGMSVEVLQLEIVEKAEVEETPNPVERRMSANA